MAAARPVTLPRMGLERLGAWIADRRYTGAVPVLMHCHEGRLIEAQILMTDCRIRLDNTAHEDDTVTQ